MNKSQKAFSARATIVNELGLHAHSAAKISQIAKHAQGDVYIIRDDEAADAKDMLELLTIACPQGTTVTIKIDSPHDMEILEAIVQLVQSGFGE